MANYTYEAIDQNGKRQRSNIEADSQEKAVEQIRRNGLVPVRVQEAGVLGKEIQLRSNRKVKPKKLAVFCKQFVSMLKAGVPLVDAMQMMTEQTEDVVLQEALRDCTTEVKRGNSLSEAMSQNPNAFPKMLVNMVAAGETSGNIEESFSRMAVQYEKSAKLSGMLIKAMVYPIALIIVIIVVFFVMILKIIPTYAKTFADNGMELPGITKAMMAMSDFVGTWWYLFVIAIVALIVGVILYKRSQNGTIFFARMATRMLLFGDLNVKTYSSQFARTLSTLIHAGIPLLDAINAVSKTMKNYLFREHLEEVAEEVSRGIPLSEPIRRAGMFPPMVVHMIAIGEESGDVETMLDNLADYYDEEVEMKTQTVMAAMEPAIIIAMAVVVILLVISIYSPMLSMYDQIGNL